jgi:hypothetical protein
VGSIPIPGFYTKSLYSSNIAEFLWTLKKEGLKESTIKGNYAKVLKNLEKNCSLTNPDSVLGYLASKEVSEGRKELIADVYARYCKWANIPFTKPRYKREDRLPYVPLEIDIEALVSALPRKLSIFTRTLKETGARPACTSIQFYVRPLLCLTMVFAIWKHFSASSKVVLSPMCIISFLLLFRYIRSLYSSSDNRPPILARALGFPKDPSSS